MMDSRLCIRTGGQFSGEKAMLSRTMATACSPPGGADGCQGGLSTYVIDFMRNTGLPTSECLPYFGHGEGTDHFNSHSSAPPCPTQCVPAFASRSLSSDTFRMPSLQSWGPQMHRDSVYAEVKQSIMDEGPLVYAMYAGGSFMSYRSGVYDYGQCSLRANHMVTAIGWGPNNVLSLNSWGPNWGDQGKFKLVSCVVHWWNKPNTLPGSGYPDPLVVGNDPVPDDQTFTTTPEPATTTTAPYTGDARVTDKGCPCLREWRFGSSQVSQYCGNPDNDVNGEWCFVADEGCQGTNWGYCRPSSATTQAPDTTTTTTTVVNTEKPWHVVQGGCSVDSFGCVTSPNYPKEYSNDQSCEIKTLRPAVVEVLEFNTESFFDRLTVGGQKYSGGGASLQGKSVGTGTSLQWRADYSA